MVQLTEALYKAYVVHLSTIVSMPVSRRAQTLADEIGADHLDVKIDQAVDGMAKLFALITGRTPQFKAGLQNQYTCMIL